MTTNDRRTPDRAGDPPEMDEIPQAVSGAADGLTEKETSLWLDKFCMPRVKS